MMQVELSCVWRSAQERSVFSVESVKQIRVQICCLRLCLCSALIKSGSGHSAHTSEGRSETAFQNKQTRRARCEGRRSAHTFNLGSWMRFFRCEQQQNLSATPESRRTSHLLNDAAGITTWTTAEFSVLLTKLWIVLTCWAPRVSLRFLLENETSKMTEIFLWNEK